MGRIDAVILAAAGLERLGLELAPQSAIATAGFPAGTGTGRDRGSVSNRRYDDSGTVEGAALPEYPDPN